MLLLLTSVAFAAGDPTPKRTPVAAVGVSAVGEAVQDATLTDMYGATSLSGEVDAGITLPWHLEARLVAGYRRLGGTRLLALGEPTETSTWLWYAPVSVLVGAAQPFGRLTLAGAVGPSLVFWAEQAGTDPDIGYTGAKWGALVEGELRYDLPGYAPSLHDPTGGFGGLQLEGTVGYRMSALRHGAVCGDAESCGLALSALRVGLGVRAWL
jgi:hypothetical protein